MRHIRDFDDQRAHMMDIRAVDRRFANELAELCARTFAEAYRGVNSDADIRAYCTKTYAPAVIESNLASADVTYQVAFKEDRAVGFFMLKDQPCPVRLTGAAMELKQIYVLASEFGTGLGRQLLRAAMQCACAQNRTWLWLSVSDSNQRARAFYRKHGFSAVGPAPVLEVGEARLRATLMVCEVC